MRSLLLPFLFLLAACQGAAAPVSEATPAGGGTGLDAGFRLEDAAGEKVHTLRPGDKARFVFALHNAGATPVILRYTFPPHRLRLLPEGGGEPVWQAWQGRMFPQVMREQALAAGASENFVVEWTVPADFLPGRYRAEPELSLFAGERRWQPRLAPLELAVAP